MYQVIVIGGGVIGGALLRELTKYCLSVCLLEKSADVCMGQSRANSGIVHAGFDAKPGTLKAKFNVSGNRIMETLCKELGVKYENNGSLVVAFDEAQKKTLEELKARGEANGVEGLYIVDGERLRAMEKNISDFAVAALVAPTGGIVCPYELTIACIGNAMDNGAALYTNFEVVGAEKTQSGYKVYSAKGECVEGEIVVNCAGAGGGEVAKAFQDESIEIKGRKGEYILLDQECGDFASHTLFFTPTEKGKGILVSPTVDRNIILGPTAQACDKDDNTTTQQGLAEVVQKANEMCKDVPLFHAITSFCGVRTYTDKHDFIIEESKTAENLIHVVGIESPGLTSAPAIAQYVVEELVGKKIALTKRKDFNGRRTADHFFHRLTDEEKNELIRKDPAYGNVVCRCEQITEGEIVRAVHANPPATTVDAVKRRTRAGMGRCQGGFCMPSVAEILSRELGVPLEKVNKGDEGSYLVTGVTK